jgi:hypothetical protein
MNTVLRRHPLTLPAAVLTVAALLVSAGPAGAAALTRATVPLFSLACELAGPAGTATLHADQQGAEEHASAALWSPGAAPAEDPPVLVSSGFTLVRDGAMVTGTVAMVDGATEEDAGEATFTARLEPFGAPLVGDSAPLRFGNIVDRSYRSEQEATVTGGLQLPDGSQFALDGCTGTLGEIVIVRNTPEVVVEHLPGEIFGFCLAPGADGHTLALLLLDEHDEVFVELALLPPDGDDPLLFGFDAVALGRTALTGRVALVDDQGEFAGEAVIAGTVEAHRPRIVKGEESDVRFKTFFRDFTVHGDVTVTDYGSFALDGACEAGYQRGFLRYPNPEA